jgi:hypothetical protein
MALDFSCQVQRHPLTERGSDCYDTPPEAVRALLEVEHLPNRIWEPCVGRGAIATVLKDAGHEVIGTDLHDYGVGYPSGIDFLMERFAPPGIVCIVSNPPFMLAQQFIEKALELAPRSTGTDRAWLSQASTPSRPRPPSAVQMGQILKG